MQTDATRAAQPDRTTPEQEATGPEQLAAYSLIDAMTRRRARRFALGITYTAARCPSGAPRRPVPLSTEEEAILAFAGRGHGRVNGELPYQPDAGPETGGGQVMMSMVGRTHSSADAVATATLFITRDDGTFAMPKPQDYSPRTSTMSWRPSAASTDSPRCTAQPHPAERRPSEIPRELPLHPAVQQVVGQHPRLDLFRPGDRDDRRST